MFNKNSGLSEVIDLGKNPERKQIRGIFRDDLKRVWFTTQNAGFAEFLPLDNSVNFITDSQQEALNVKSIISDKSGVLWLSTENGIIRWNNQKNKFYKYIHSDGVQLKNFNENAAIMGLDNELLFGGAGGILHFNPLKIQQKTFSPQVVIDEFRLFNQPISVGKQLPMSIDYISNLELTNEDYLFSLSFSALDYTAPEKNLYAYKLEGLDKNWIYTDSRNRTATYTALSPGDYTFTVKASDSHGNWSENETSLDITILPPWWRTWSAYFFYIVAILLMTILLIHIRTRTLKQRASELEQNVQDRTLELEQKNKTISVLLEQKQRMFTNISHEFRTPLTLIINPIKQLLKQAHIQEDRLILMTVKRNGLRLLKMVEQLLELAHLESPKKSQKVHYSLKHSITSILASFKPLAQIKMQTLTLGHVDDVVMKMQSNSLEIIITNLISNAIKYTPEGGEIAVQTRLDANTVELLVEDSGIGIEVKYQQSVFERFHRGTHEINEEIPGAGIGLALVKELVELHQGQITLQSKIGVGSLFKLSLPFCQTQCHNQELIQVSTPQEQWIQSEIEESDITLINAELTNEDSRPILLIIEDNNDMRKHLISILHVDYHCIQASNGYDGLKLAKLHVPDMIICDVMMPKMDGYEFSQSVKQDNILSHIPIILLTAKADLQSRMEGWRRHIDDYLTKPFDDDELKLRLKSLLTIRALLHKHFANEMHNKQAEVIKQFSIRDQDFIKKFEISIEENYSQSEFQLSQAASYLAMSDRQLQRKLKAIMNLTFSEYVRNYRLQKAEQLLKDGLFVHVVLEVVGFSSPSYFASCFKTKYGKTPKQFQQEVIK